MISYSKKYEPIDEAVSPDIIKKTFNVLVGKTIGKKVTYKFKTKYGGFIGVQFRTDESNNVHCRWGLMDFDGNIIGLLKVKIEEIANLNNIRTQCLNDFLKVYPEYKYFIIE